MQKNKPTMQRIADELGITKVSVSKALNGQTGISEQLRMNVILKAGEMGYSKSKSYNRQKPLSFAFFVPKRFFLESENYYTTIYYYLNRRTLADGNRLDNFVVNLLEENGDFLPKSFDASLFDGIFISGEMSESFLSLIAALKKPTVCIDFFNPDFDFDCVIVDNFYMGFYTTNLLIRNGCKKIGFVGNPEQTNSIMDRHYGYAKALNRARLPVREDWLIVNNDTETNLFSLNFPLPEERLDAYVCHCDMAAYYLIMKLEHAGIRVPEQTSVVSFDNTVLGETVTPKLSSMSVDKKDFANTSYELLTQRIRDGAAPARKQYMNCRMFMRDSVRLSNVE